MLNLTTYGDQTDSPTLLIAHGLFGAGRNWGALAKRLSQTRRVITVDMRNHGESPWYNSHNYKDLAADLAEVIDTLDRPVDVLGHSMGGKAAMVLALTRPELVNRLIVADIAPVRYDHGQMQYIEAMKAVDLGKVKRRADAEAQLSDLLEDPILPGFFTQSIDIKAKQWRLNLEVLAREMPGILSFPKHLTDPYEGPALFLSGADSHYVKREYRPVIKQLFPAAQFAKIPDAGHWLHAEKPREFEAALRVWLEQSAPPAT